MSLSLRKKEMKKIQRDPSIQSSTGELPHVGIKEVKDAEEILMLIRQGNDWKKFRQRVKTLNYRDHTQF